MIYRNKAKRSADKASAIFCTTGIHKSTSVFCSMFLSSNYDIIVLSHCFNIPFKFTVKGKICGYSPTRIDSLLEASAALVILELSEDVTNRSVNISNMAINSLSHIHRFF
jgi:hypothetical protein